MWICWIFGHKFKEFRVTEWGFPYNMGFWKQFDHCLRCGKSKEGATMKNQIAWAKAYIKAMNERRPDDNIGQEVAGWSLYNLAKAILADAEGGNG